MWREVWYYEKVISGGGYYGAFYKTNKGTNELIYNS